MFVFYIFLIVDVFYLPAFNAAKFFVQAHDIRVIAGPIAVHDDVFLLKSSAYRAGKGEQSLLTEKRNVECGPVPIFDLA